MDYSIQPFHDEHLGSLVHLLNRSFSIQNAAKTDLIRWKFFDTFHHGGTVMYIAVDEAGEVVSHYSNFPLQIAAEGQYLRGMVCADMATDSAYRGKGLISLLSRQVYTDIAHSGADLSIGYSNEAGVQVDKNAKGYGYRVIGRFARYVTVLLRPQATPYRLIPATGFNPAFTPAPQPGLCVHKSYEYLDWRYCRKPNAQYLIYRIMRDQTLAGYAVLLENRARCYVYDLVLGDNCGSMPEILRAVHNTCLKRGKRLVLFYVLDNAFWRATLRGYICLPPRLNKKHYYLTAKPHRDDLPAGWESPEAWYLIGGDIL